MPMGAIAMIIMAVVALISATITRRSWQIRNRIFARMILALASPSWIYNFPIGRMRFGQSIRTRPHVVDIRTMAPSVADNDILFRITTKIDGCSVTTCRRELLAPVPSKIAARNFVVLLTGRRVARRIYVGIHVRTWSRRAARFTMMIRCWMWGLRDSFYRSDSVAIVRRSWRYVASAFA